MKLTGNQCRCTACQELFRTVRAFDKHRRGPYTARRCLTQDELVSEGFARNSYGFWMSPRKPGTDLSHWRKRKEGIVTLQPSGPALLEATPMTEQERQEVDALWNSLLVPA